MAASQLSAFIQQLRQPMAVPDGGSHTDAQLMDSFIDRKDEAAFQAIVFRHGPMVLSVCRRLLRNHHDVEDAFQATFLVLVRKAVSVRPREMVGSFLHGTAYNTALKARAIAARRQIREQQLLVMPELEAREQDQDLALRPVLDQELARLPEKYRLPIVLCHLEGKSIDGAAHQLNWPQGTLAGRLARGRALLAKRLARHGLTVSVGSFAIVLSQDAALAAVSSLLASVTIEAATALAVDQAVPHSISKQVITLMNGGPKPMFVTKLKMATATLFAVTLIGIGVGVSLGGHEVPPRTEEPARWALSKSKTDKEPFYPLALTTNVLADKNILQNPGIEEGEKTPAHWSQGDEIDGVEYIWDKEVGYKSKSSLCLHKTAKRYFPIAQWSQKVERVGDSAEISLSAQVKAEKVTKAILDLIFIDDKDEWISHEWAAYIGAKNANDAPADHDWKEYSGRVKIPKGTKRIEVGLQLYGPGKVWFDEVRAAYVE